MKFLPFVVFLWTIAYVTVHAEPQNYDTDLNDENVPRDIPDDITDERLKQWYADMFTTKPDDLSEGGYRRKADEVMPAPSKRSGTIRLCGSKLVEAIVKLCNGCVKPAGGKAVSAKRSLTTTMKRGQTLTDKCCVNRCSFEDMKSFCCEQ